MKGVNSEACGDELENSAGGSGSTTKRSKPSEPETVGEVEEDLDTEIIGESGAFLDRGNVGQWTFLLVNMNEFF